MIEWKHKKIEDTCDIMVQANSACVYCVRILAGKELHKYVIRKVKCVTIPFSTKTTFPPGCSGGI